MTLPKYPKCPKCGARHNRVILVRRLEHDEHLRRRHCETCSHRWYSIQYAEEALSTHQIKWEGRRPSIRRDLVGAPQSLAAKALEAFWAEEHQNETLDSEKRMVAAFCAVSDHLVPSSNAR